VPEKRKPSGLSIAGGQLTFTLANPGTENAEQVKALP
jgi:hypothetical protein